MMCPVFFDAFESSTRLDVLMSEYLGRIRRSQMKGTMDWRGVARLTGLDLRFLGGKKGGLSGRRLATLALRFVWFGS